MARVELKNVSKVFRGPRREEIIAVAGLSMVVEKGECVVLLGPSGCGKTTTLRLIAGLEQLTDGSVSIDGLEMNEVRPQDRAVALMFQRDALYPHLTTLDNIGFGLKIRGCPGAEVELRVRETAAMLGLAKVLERRPAALSGGERQRVALARAVVRQPKVLLLDEPLSNLDPLLRAQMRAELVALLRRVETTTLCVTHDHAEGMALGQRVAVMNEGSIEQIGTPLAIYQTPANLFVAGFVGSPPMNFFRGRVVARGEEFIFLENNLSAVKGARMELRVAKERGARVAAFAEGNVVLGVRPEHIAPGEAKGSAITAVIEWIERLGSQTRLHLNTGEHRFIALGDGSLAAFPGERMDLHVSTSQLHFFNPASGKAIV